MARQERSSKLDSRTARAKLEPRDAPYWHLLSKGLSLGYRRGLKGGTWQARSYEAGQGYRKANIGIADDKADADGVTALDFHQACEKARQWLLQAKAPQEANKRGPYTVADAIDDYRADLTRRGAKDMANVKSRVDLHILPALGRKPVADLTAKGIREWHAALASKPRMGRRGKLGNAGKPMEPRENDLEAERRRRSSANRTLTVLKAALNHAFREGRVAADEAWRRVKPFENVDGVRNRFLSNDEAAKLISACEANFQKLVRAALLTGARYGELTRLRIADVNLNTPTIFIRESKSGKPRHVHLSPAGRSHFAAMIADKAANDLVFVRSDGEPWRASDQVRRIKDACDKAKIIPPIMFHGLRDTHASALVAAGVSLQIVAEQLGHADTRVTEKHYAHLAPSARASAITAHLPEFS